MQLVLTSLLCFLHRQQLPFVSLHMSADSPIDICSGPARGLEDDWVEENIAPKVRQRLKSNAGVLCKSPAGDVRSKGNLCNIASTNTDAPECVFRQGDHRTCVFLSFASCIHHLGHMDLGCRMQLLAENQSCRVDNSQRLKKAVDTGTGKPCTIGKHEKGKLDLSDESQQVETDGQCHP
mmetsp:Transcript_24426/g.34083  ORF Transcript_24426/g.34083 Transcript_24426/m.34083 type:complete len:179 (-) Transcript_24426:71-607(-)